MGALIYRKGQLASLPTQNGQSGVKGTKSIPFSSITAIQFKKSGLARGYLQFTIPGGNESRRGLTDAASDENTFMFAGNNELALEIKNYIETRIRDLRNERLSPSGGLMDQLLKLAEMKEKGLLSEDEFLNAKKRLLS